MFTIPVDAGIAKCSSDVYTHLLGAVCTTTRNSMIALLDSSEDGCLAIIHAAIEFQHSQNSTLLNFLHKYSTEDGYLATIETAVDC